MSSQLTTGRPAVGYVRVSTEDQAREGVSLDVQRARIAAHAINIGLDLDPDIHADEGISGRRSHNRPGLMRAIELACERRASVVVYSLSRFARSTADCITLVGRLRKAGANLVSITEAIDTLTAHGTFFFTLLAALAQMESELTSERVRAIAAHKRARGEHFGVIPYGFRAAADGVHVEVDAGEAAMLDRLLELRLEGKSYPAITRAAEAEGFRNRRGKPFPVQQVARFVARRGRDRGIDVAMTPEAIRASRLAGLVAARIVQANNAAARRAAMPPPKPKLRKLPFPRTLALVLDGRQTETRREGWRDVTIGERLAVVDRARGHVRGEIEVLAVRRERLSRTDEAGVRREGFATWSPAEFVAHHLGVTGGAGDPEVTVITFRRADP